MAGLTPPRDNDILPLNLLESSVLIYCLLRIGEPAMTERSTRTLLHHAFTSLFPIITFYLYQPPWLLVF